jgi:hypothetical protein
VYALGATALAALTGVEPEDLPHRGLAIDVEAALGRGRRPELVSVLRSMVEPDPDRRSARVGPLLARLSGARSDEGRERHRHDKRDKKHERERDKRDGERDKRDERREARDRERADRHERRQREREERRDRALRGAPPIVGLVVSLTLFAVQLALTLTLRVAVPIVLNILSILFGRALSRAASSVSDAGARADAAIGRARAVVRGEAQPPRAEDRVRVEQVEPPKVRIEDRDHDVHEEDEDQDEESRKRR